MLKYKQEGCSEGEGSESKKQRKFHNMNRYSHCFQLFLCSHEFSSFTSSQCSGKKCFVPCFFDQCTGGWMDPFEVQFGDSNDSGQGVWSELSKRVVVNLSQSVFSIASFKGEYTVRSSL